MSPNPFQMRQSTPAFQIRGFPRLPIPMSSILNLVLFASGRLGTEIKLCCASSHLWSWKDGRPPRTATWTVCPPAIPPTGVEAMDSSWKMLQLVFFSCLFSLAVSLPTISVIGSKFYDSDGNQFFIKGTSTQEPFRRLRKISLDVIVGCGANWWKTGVVYQPGGTGISYDPLSTTTQCTQDVSALTTICWQD